MQKQKTISIDEIEASEIFTALLLELRKLQGLYEETGSNYTATRITTIKKILEKLK